MPMGKIIEIEGTDGSGKETQSYLLADNLKRLGIDAEVVSFPDYNSASSGPVKQFLNGDFGTRDELSPMEIAMLYAFDRSYTFRKLKLREKLGRGTWIIFDRYIGSNIIYQTAGSTGVNFAKTYINILKLEHDILNLPSADYTIYLNLPIEISKELIDIRGNKKDINEIDDNFLSTVSNHGMWCASNMNWDIINCYYSGFSTDETTGEKQLAYRLKSKDCIANTIFQRICKNLLNMKIGD